MIFFWRNVLEMTVYSEKPEEKQIGNSKRGTSGMKNFVDFLCQYIYGGETVPFIRNFIHLNVIMTLNRYVCLTAQ